MNAPTTSDQVIAESVVAEPLDQLLRQIVNGYFVLTDGNGAVSKWSEPAELLFGRPAEEILGESFFETLIGGALPPAGQAWRMFLDAGEPPRVPGTVELTGRTTDGADFPMEAVFVPVKLDEGFDFSLFLEDLSFDLPLNLMLMRMRQQHPVVVRALRGGIEPDAQPWGGGRTAGTLVVFKPLQPTPWVEAELARRDAQRAAADAEAEERLTNTDPGIQGSVNDLDDAAAVVARLLSALERIDDLERVAGGLPAQLEESRRESDRRSEALRADVQRALSAVPSQLDTTEQLARVERLERARMDAEEAGAEQRRALAAAESLVSRLSSRVDQVEHRGTGVSDERLAEAIAAAESRLAAARAGLESRVAELERAAAPDLGAQLERVRAEHEEAASAARAELAAAVERLSREREHEREADRAELAAALEVVERVRREADAVREQLAAATVERSMAGEDRRRLDELQTAADQLAARVEALRAEPASGELRDAIGRHDAALQELAELVELPAQIAEFRVTSAAQLTEVIYRADAAEQLVRELEARQEATAAEVAGLREAQATGDPAPAAELRDAVARHEAALAELREAQEAAARRDDELAARAAAEVAELREAAARAAGAAAEVAELREAVAGAERAAAGVAELRDAAARAERAAAEVAELRDAAARAEGAAADIAARHAADVAELRDAAGRRDDTVAELRDATARAEAAAADVAARHDADLFALREATARHDDALAGLAELRAAAARAETAAARHDGEVADLRRALAEAGPAPADAAPDALPRLEVETLVGDARRELAALREQVAADLAGLASRDDLSGLASHGDLDALHARLDGLAGRDELAGLAGRGDVDALHARVDGLAGRDEVDALHARLDGLAGRDELAGLAGRGDVDALHARLDGVAGRDELAAFATRDDLSGLAAREDLHALHARLDGLAGRDELSALAPRDDLDALRARLDGLAARDELAGLASRDQLDELREDLAAAAARHELDELRAAGAALAARLDELAAGSGQELAQEAIRRIEAVDRGAGTVLADVRALRERIEEALSLARSAQETGRAENEELRELLARLGGELEVARGGLERAESEALGARQAASAADQAAAAARTDAATAREEAAAARRDLDGDRERLTLLGDEVARLADGLSGVRETASETRAEAAGLGERFAAVDRQAETLRAELGAGRERLTALDSQVGRLSETVGQAEDARRAADARAAALRSEIGQVRDVAETADAGLRALRDELVRVREEALSVRTEFAAVREAAEAAKADARRGDQRVEAMQSELAYALASLEELKQGLSSAGQAAVIARREAEQARKAAQHAGDGSTERVTEVFQQILGMAAARGGAGRPRRDAPTLAPKKPEPVKREPRHGFDDVAAPQAILALDGKFKELNPAFAKLVGYQEHEFAKAAWPSPHDRRDYKDQLEQLAKLKAGELREVEVQSTYMHGQGLMVPVIGKLSAVAGEDGLPSHLVLTAEDRHHS